MVREKVVGLGEGSDRGMGLYCAQPLRSLVAHCYSEIEGFFNLLSSHLVTLFSSTADLEPHVSALVGAIVGAPETHTGIKYRV